MSNHFERPRRELFTSEATAAAFTYFLTLSEEARREFHAEAQRLLSAPNGPGQTQRFRVREAIRGLTEAVVELGHPPSVADYEALRIAHPEYDWRPARSVKRWLAVKTWNEALRRAHLPAAAEPDTVHYEHGDPFTAAETIAALQECAADIGRVPCAREYCSWSHRDDVRRRPGRRPLSERVAIRIFRTFSDGLVAAGLLECSIRRESGFAGYAYSRADLTGALRLVATRLGRSPRIFEYKEERLRRPEETEQGRQRILPSDGTIIRHFASWGNALVAAELAPVGDWNHVAFGHPPETRKRTPMWSDEQCLAALREARRELGDPLFVTSYQAWRVFETRRDSRRHYDLPSTPTIRLRFATWQAAICASMSDEDRRG
jgi:hypothetical protein